MADIKITLNNISSNSRFGEGWDTIKASDSKPFGDYAKQAVKFIIKVVLKPFRSLYSAGKAVLAHKVPVGKWSKETDSDSSVWTRVKDTVSTSWKKENE